MASPEKLQQCRYDILHSLEGRSFAKINSAYAELEHSYGIPVKISWNNLQNIDHTQVSPSIG